MMPVQASPPDHTLPSTSHLRAPQHLRAHPSDPNLLSPDDAFTQSPPRKYLPGNRADGNPITSLDKGVTTRPLIGNLRRREKDRGRSGSRRKRVWKKLLWVQQTYPDNYTDEETFLDHLQRNPRLQPYDFWPLVADSTAIVQHVCSVIIFVCCFVGIFQERVSPVTVVTWGSVGTVLGWIVWDSWMGQEAALKPTTESKEHHGEDASSASSTTSSFVSGASTKDFGPVHGLGLSFTSSDVTRKHSHSASATSTHSANSAFSLNASVDPNGATISAGNGYYPPYGTSVSSLSPRNQQRLATAKSAILIYCALLGLSPILKSLTISTTPDSIWALSCWLMCINVFFFDYSGGVGVKFPASLSTNAALMASTVLASRLPSTIHVFSLTLFSIEVFGLFPVFRRHLRHVSSRAVLTLTLFLVMGAGGGVGVTVSGGGWAAAAVGLVLGCLLTGLTMGACSWWLIGLQKYKNEIHGPWDPARPIIRRHWD